MEPTDLTIKLLQEIRDDGRKTRDELTRRLDDQSAQVAAQSTHVNARFEAIETSLRDMAQQLVMLARLAVLEKQSPH